MNLRPALVALIATHLPPTTHAARITPIDQPYSPSHFDVTTVSPTGTHVAYTVSGHMGEQVYLWHNGEATLLPGAFETVGISTDGLILAGTSLESADEPAAYRWTSAGGTQQLLPPEPYGTYAGAYGMSHDGDTIVGNYWGETGYQAMRWTSTTGMQTLDSGGQRSIAHAVSGDGSTAVGYVGTGPTTNAAVRWNEAGVMQTLTLSPGVTDSSAQAVSDDGSVILGHSNLGSFRWTEDDGMLIIGNTNVFSNISGDGRLFSAGNTIWDEDNGLRNLSDVLTALGTDVTKWTFGNINSIGYDGLYYYLVGVGSYYGDITGYLVALDASAVPEPTTWTLLGFSAILFFVPLRRIA